MFDARHVPRILKDVLQGASPCRSMQNLYLRGRSWRRGMRVLDVGAKPEGGKTVFHIPDADLVYANNEAQGPDVICMDITQPPEPGLGRFDCVLLLNVLEHIYDTAKVFDTVKQILKPDGEIVIMTPYLYPYHRAPLDYHRLSADWYRETAARLGYEVAELVPLSLGAASDYAGYCISYLFLLRSNWMLRPLLIPPYAAVLLWDALMLSTLRSRGKTGRGYLSNPLGYAVVLRPPTTDGDGGTEIPSRGGA